MKLTKRILAVVLVLVFALALTACGKKNELEGSWVLTGGAMFEMLGVPEDANLEEAGLSVIFAFEKDNKFKVEMAVFGEVENGEGTYEIDGSNVTMTIDGDPLSCEFKVDGDTLTLLDVADFGGDMIFTKK